MYGCRRDEKEIPYRLTKIYEMDEDAELELIHMRDVFHYQKATHYGSTPLDSAFFEAKSLEWCLPLFLSNCGFPSLLTEKGPKVAPKPRDPRPSIVASLLAEEEGLYREEKRRAPFQGEMKRRKAPNINEVKETGKMASGKKGVYLKGQELEIVYNKMRTMLQNKEDPEEAHFHLPWEEAQMVMKVFGRYLTNLVKTRNTKRMQAVVKRKKLVVVDD